jgi:hypothetical protein
MHNPNRYSTPHSSSDVVLKLLLWPHVHNLQRRIHQLDHMSRFERLGVYVIDIVRMEDAWFRAIENSLFTWRVCEAETAPAVL